MLVTSLLGILSNQELYSPYMSKNLRSASRGQDLFSLIAGALLFFSLIITIRGSLKGLIISLGILSYTLYAYLFYSIMGVMNILFIPYILTFMLCSFAFLGILPKLDFDAFTASYKTSKTDTIFAWFFIITAVLLYTLWTSEIFSYVSRKEVSDIYGVYVLDLGFLFPLFFITGINLLRKKASAYFVTGILLFKGITITLATFISALFMLFESNPVTLFDLIFFGSYSFIAGVFMIVYLNKINGDSIPLKEVPIPVKA